MEKQKQPKTLIWFVKFIIASCAISFGLFLLVGIVALPFVGSEFLDWQMTEDGGSMMSIFTVLIAPLVYFKLK